jgi:hypothetical protein
MRWGIDFTCNDDPAILAAIATDVSKIKRNFLKIDMLFTSRFITLGTVAIAQFFRRQGQVALSAAQFVRYLFNQSQVFVQTFRHKFFLFKFPALYVKTGLGKTKQPTTETRRAR